MLIIKTTKFAEAYDPNLSKEEVAKRQEKEKEHLSKKKNCDACGKPIQEGGQMESGLCSSCQKDNFAD